MFLTRIVGIGIVTAATSEVFKSPTRLEKILQKRNLCVSIVSPSAVMIQMSVGSSVIFLSRGRRMRTWSWSWSWTWSIDNRLEFVHTSYGILCLKENIVFY